MYVDIYINRKNLNAFGKRRIRKKEKEEKFSNYRVSKVPAVVVSQL